MVIKVNSDYFMQLSNIYNQFNINGTQTGIKSDNHSAVCIKSDCDGNLSTKWTFYSCIYSRIIIHVSLIAYLLV